MTKILPLAVIAVLLGTGFGLEPAHAASESAKPVAETELRAVLAEPDGFARAGRLAAYLPTLGVDAVPLVVQILKEPNAIGVGAAETELLTRFWAMHEPAAAGRWAISLPDGMYRAAAISPAVYAWVSADPEAAGTRIRGAAGGFGRETRLAQVALIRGWFSAGQPGLNEYIEALEMGFARQRAVATLLRSIHRRDGSEAVVRWAEAIPDEAPGKYKIGVFRQTSSVLGHLDLDAALKFCESHCDGPFGGSMRQLIGQRWAAVDGVAAMKWLSTAPENLERDLAVRGTFSAWQETDQDAAFAWLIAHGIDGIEPWLRPAVVIYAKLRSATDPEDAMKWAALIPPQKEREIIMVRIARRWRVKDEAAADAWIAQSPLPADRRAAIFEPDPDGAL
jgi:hypothetical protein